MRRIAFLLLVLLMPSAAWAGEVPLYQPAPNWIEAAPPVDLAKVDNDSPIILVDDMQTRIDGDKSWQYVDIATRVASAQMLDSAGSVQMEWNPDLGDLIIHSVEILRADGKTDVLAGGARFEVLRRELKLDQRILDGLRTASLTVPGLRVGDVLHVRYSITQRDPALGGQVQVVSGLAMAPLKIGYGRMRVIWPTTQKIRWKVLAEGVVARTQTKKGMTELTFDLPLPKAPDLPDDAPLRFRPIPLLVLTGFDDWQAVSRVMAPLYATDGLIEPGSALAAEVEKIRAAESDPLKRTELALRLVQDQISYFFNGLNGGSYVPQKPAETWRLRYGDCKAKTVLLLAILHALDIDAEPVLASLKLGDVVPQQLPLPGAFDHVLVLAHIDGRDYWLDGTDRGTRLTDLSDVPDFRHALPVRAAGSGLMDVPFRADARADMASDVELDNRAGLMLPSLFKASFMVRGAMAEQLNTGIRQADSDSKLQLVSALLRPLVGEVMISTYDFKFDPESSAMTVTATGLTASAWHRNDRVYAMTLDQTIDATQFSPDRARPAWQKIPVSAGSPIHVTGRRTLLLPSSAAAFAIEGDRSFDKPIGGSRIDRTLTIADDRVVLSDDIRSFDPEIAPDQLAAAREAVAQAKAHLLKIKAPADYPNRLAVIQAARKSGRLQALLNAYKAGIDRDPDESTGYRNRVHFLIGIYDYKAALADLDMVIKLDPSAENYSWRAGLRTTLGDAKGALADAREAFRLEPGDSGYAATLAQQLAKNGQKAEGLELIDRWIAQGGKEKVTLLTAKADMLAEAGDADAAIKVSDEALAAGPQTADLMNARCWLKGRLNVELDKALKECSRSIEMADSALQALDSRALIYFRMGRYDDAMADLKAVLDESPDTAASRYLRGVVRSHMGDKAGGAADMAAARLMAPRIDDTYVPFGIKP